MPEFTYKGTPPRPWIRLELITPDGETHVVEAVADTGNPLPLIVSSALMFDCCHLGGPGTETNFGRLDGGFIRVRIPETGVDAMIFGYASDASDRMEHSAKQVVAALEIDAVGTGLLDAVRRLTRHTTFNTVSARRRIADAVIEAGRYNL